MVNQSESLRAVSAIAPDMTPEEKENPICRYCGGPADEAMYNFFLFSWFWYCYECDGDDSSNID